MTVTVEKIRDLIDEAGTMADMETLTNDIALTEQGVDSLDAANIYLLIEEAYEIKIPDGDLDQLKNVNDIVAYLNDK